MNEQAREDESPIDFPDVSSDRAGMSLRFPTWMAGSHGLLSSLLPPKVYISSEVEEREKPALKASHSCKGSRHPTQQLNHWAKHPLPEFFF